jgi:hypothetical protein
MIFHGLFFICFFYQWLDDFRYHECSGRHGMIFCRSPDPAGDSTMIYTIKKVCLAVPASARRGVIPTRL